MFLRGGGPINFGSLYPTPPVYIQLTRGLMFLGALSAARLAAEQIEYHARGIHFPNGRRKYQKAVCVPEGMSVTFLGIGPIGATILAVELLKLPIAVWTASRKGYTKMFMLFVGLPLICLLNEWGYSLG